MRLRYQVLLLALVPLAIAVGLALHEVGGLLGRMDDALNTKLIEQRDVVRAQVKEVLALTEETAAVIASSEDIQLGIQTADSDLLFQQGGLFLRSGINYITFVDNTGMTVARAHDEFFFGDYQNREALIKIALSGHPFSGLTIHNEIPLIVSAAPVRNYAGGISGVVLAGITLKGGFLKTLAERLDARLTVERRGKLVADSGTGEIDPGLKAITMKTASQDGHIIKFTIYKDNRHDTAMLTELRNRIALYSAILAVVLTSLILFFSNRLVAPIKALAEAMLGYTRQSKTDFDLARPSNEVGDLVRTFEGMVGEIEANRRSLVAAEKKYRTIFENANEGIYQMDSDGSFTAANPALASIYEAQSVDYLVEGADVATLYTDPEAHAAFLAEVLDTGKVNDREFTLAFPDGREKLVRESAKTLDLDDGSKGVEGTVRDVTERLRKEIAERERSMAQAASQAKSIFLDNSGQGFLSFGTDMAVEPEYSRECEKLLPNIAPGADIVELLFPGGGSKKAHFATNIARILSEADPFRLDLYLSLMPNEFSLGERVVHSQYKVVDGKVMLILTDITNERELEKKARQEQDRLRFIVSTVRYNKDFFDILSGYQTFREKVLAEVENASDLSKERVSELYREVHTYKGLFSQQDFINLPDALHEAEAGIHEILAPTGTEGGPNNLATLVNQCDEATTKDIAIIKESLGDVFLGNGPTVTLSSDQVEACKRVAGEVLARNTSIKLPDWAAGHLEEMMRLGRASLKESLGQYAKTVARLSERLGKELAPLEIAGSDALLDSEAYDPFIKSLVHVFRNAVDHGIETPDERLEMGKESEAAITCEISHPDENTLVLAVADNGRGIDPDMVRERAVERGLFGEEEAIAMPDEQVYSLLFENMFTMKDDVSDISGRGVGLSAVQAEVRALGGSIEITSEQGRGTTFTFTLPWGDALLGQQ